MKTMDLTQEQLVRVHSHLFKKYPWLRKGNSAYRAELISLYRVSYDEKFEDDIKEALS